MINPVKIDPEKLAGLDWSLKDFNEEENIETILIPQKSLMYETSEGSYSIRFTDYVKKENNPLLCLKN